MQKKKSFKITLAAYITVGIAFAAFVFYMLMFEHNDIYKKRVSDGFAKAENVSQTEITDPTAPMGLRREYRFTIDKAGDGEKSIMFYTVHQLVNVRIGSETVYCLNMGEGKTGASPSSNWVEIPLRPTDEGSEVTVTVTPVLKSALNREIDIFVGSKYDFFANRFKLDLPQLTLSCMCIIMGVVLITAQIIMLIRKKTSMLDNFYLGNFSVLMGIWRITDTRFSSIIFENSTKALGYITISALFIMPIPLVLFVDELHSGKHRILLRTAAAVTAVGALAALLCQIFGIAELRDLLILCHLMLLIDMAVCFFCVAFFRVKNNKERDTRLFVFLLVLGGMADLIHYYVRGTSSGMLITMVTFLIWTFCQFIESVLGIRRKVYIDANTNLFNKTYWVEYVENNVREDEAFGIMMFDINKFKYINDTFGHEGGDRVISVFADVLRKTVGCSELVCRWGGDEFAVFVRNADEAKITHYISEIDTELERCNESGKGEKIYFACGYALSNDYPTLSKNELFAKADELMYENKKIWHDANVGIYDCD